MRVWTSQPVKVYDSIKEGNIFRCDRNHPDYTSGSHWSILEKVNAAYSYMADQMRKRIGPPPEGVEFPVWAWHTFEGKHKKPDLRKSAFRCFPITPRVCMELEVPDELVLLSDESLWYAALNNVYSSLAKDKAEFDAEMQWYESLSKEEQEKVKVASWNTIFDLTRDDSEYTGRGEYIQATFWEIRPEYVIDVREMHYRR